MVWGLAVCGIILNSIHFHRYAPISVVLYLGLGWLGLVTVFPLRDALALGGLIALVSWELGDNLQGKAVVGIRYFESLLFSPSSRSCSSSSQRA